MQTHVTQQFVPTQHTWKHSATAASSGQRAAGAHIHGHTPELSSTRYRKHRVVRNVIKWHALCNHQVKGLLGALPQAPTHACGQGSIAHSGVTWQCQCWQSVENVQRNSPLPRLGEAAHDGSQAGQPQRKCHLHQRLRHLSTPRFRLSEDGLKPAHGMDGIRKHGSEDGIETQLADAYKCMDWHHILRTQKGCARSEVRHWGGCIRAMHDSIRHAIVHRSAFARHVVAHALLHVPATKRH